MAAYLFHGPCARGEAIRKAESLGRMISDPLGETGLGVDQGREIASLLLFIPVGDERGTLVIGPFDLASREAADSLLKTIEEHDSRYVIPVLWAEDIEAVSSTIRSRCHEVWCPGSYPESVFAKVAEGICRAALENKMLVLIESLKELEGQENDVVRAAVGVLVNKSEWPLERRLLLWESLRDSLERHRGNMNFMSALAAFLL